MGRAPGHPASTVGSVYLNTGGRSRTVCKSGSVQTHTVAHDLDTANSRSGPQTVAFVFHRTPHNTLRPGCP